VRNSIQGEFAIPALFGWFQGNADPIGSSNALLVGSLVVTCAMIACIAFLRLFFYSEASPTPVAQESRSISPPEAGRESSLRSLAAPAVAPSSPRPLLPLQVRLAVQGNSAHAIASPLADDRKDPRGPAPKHIGARPQQPPPRRPLKQSARPPNPKQRAPISEPKAKDAEDDDAVEKYGIPEIDELYQTPPDRTSEPKVHEVILDSTDPRHRALPAFAVAMRQSSIARHVDDLGRTWIQSNPAPLAQHYLQFKTCHSLFSPLSMAPTSTLPTIAEPPPLAVPNSDATYEISAKDSAPLLASSSAADSENDDPIL
jgi:hypothetical protein